MTRTTTKHRHVGAYALLVEKDAVLLVRKQRGPYRGYWDLPGGGLERDESPLAALTRELDEETGLLLTSATLLTTTRIRCCHLLDRAHPEELDHVALIYRATTPDAIEPEVVAGEEDISQAAWLPLDRLAGASLTPVAQEALHFVFAEDVGSEAATKWLEWRVDSELDLEALDEIVLKSESEGFRFLARLQTDWLEQTNRFDGDDEILIQVFSEGSLVAIGGLNRDPYDKTGSSGRLRRLYVHPEMRGCGLGRQLVMRLVEHASDKFERVTLRTDSSKADDFYRHLGFLSVDEDAVTHLLPLR